MTRAAHSFQKHCDRIDNRSFFKNFSNKTGDQDAIDAIKSILDAKGQNVSCKPNKVTGGWEIYNKHTGQGFKVSKDGLFSGFLDWKLKNVTL